MKKNKSLLEEAKSFQAIRILNIFFEEMEMQREEKHINYLSAKLFEVVNEFQEFKFHIDAFFFIDKAFYLNRVSYQRKNEKSEIVPIKFDVEAISHPLYVLFTSAFNEGIDRSFRDAIQVLGSDSRLEPISYYLFSPMKFNTKYVFDKTELRQKRFALMFFQIKDATLARHLTDEDKLFDAKLFNKEKNEIRDFEIIAYGILKGDIEGFILFDIKTTSEEAFLKKLQTSGTNSAIGKYCPLTVFFCHWEDKYSDTEKFELLRDISI